MSSLRLVVGIRTHPLQIHVHFVWGCHGDVLLWYRVVMATCSSFISSHALKVLKAPVQLQYAFALNRRNSPGDRDKALTILEKVQLLSFSLEYLLHNPFRVLLSLYLLSCFHWFSLLDRKWRKRGNVQSPQLATP